MKTIFAKDFGILPNDNTDYTRKIYELLESHKKDTTIIFESGRYFFDVDSSFSIPLAISNSDYIGNRNVSIVINSAINLIVDFKNSTLEFSGLTMPISVTNSSSVSLCNFKVDYINPFSAECTVISTGEDFFDFRINQDLFPSFAENGILYFKNHGDNIPLSDCGHCEFEYNTNKIALNGGDKISQQKVLQLSSDTFRMFISKESIPSINNIIVLRYSPRTHSGLFAECCKDLVFSNITFYSAPGLGISMQFTENMTFTNVNFIPNKNRNISIISGHDDGIQLSNTSGEIIVENCSFHGLMDDPINVHGTCTSLTEIIDCTTLKGRYMHHQAKGFLYWAKENDIISFIDNRTMTTIATSTVLSYELINEDEFIIKTKEKICDNIKPTFAIENLTNTPSFTCRNNVFGSCRARGLLISTPKEVKILDNIFDSSGTAILVAGDSNNWYESGACHNVLIKNNIFTDACLSSLYQFCNGIISIYPEVPNPDLALPYHDNITIEDNKFYASDYPVLFAKNTNNLTFSNNSIYRSYRHAPFHSIKSTITLDFCSNVKIQSTKYIGDCLGKNISFSNMSFSDITLLKDETLFED
ncbi:MAG: hypothetical protein RR088_00780 [Clostridia bacterium]